MSAPSLTVMLLTVSGISLRRQAVHNSYVSDPRPMNGASFDYIIAGGGAAGCALAGRISAANRLTTVLLLEAGGPQSVVTDMPGNYQIIVGGEYDWNYNIVQQRYAGLFFPQVFTPRAKVLGGGSTSNWSMYLRGNPQDYNNWATTYGLTNMSWAHVLEYFKLFENNTNPDYVRNGLHGTSGPITISSETIESGMQRLWTQNMVRVGYPRIDLNGPTQLGTNIGQLPFDHKHVRSSSATGYIENYPKRPNLLIVVRAHVNRILFSPDGTRAIGVQYRDKKTESTIMVFAKKEVIVSAGSTNTPQILMLSGVGPRDHLNSLNIPVVRDLPVGNNLHDFVISPVYYRIHDVALVHQYPDYNTENEYNYFAHADGPLAHYPISYTYHVTTNNLNRTWPDGLIVATVEFLNDFQEVVATYATNNDAWANYWRPVMQLENGTVGYFLSVLHCLARPKSRGTIRLNATDPEGPPLIDPNYLANPADFQAVVDMSRFTLQTMRNNPIVNVTLAPPIPGCPQCGADCEVEYLNCHVRALGRSFYNLVGSARMGTVGDPDAVVDPNFRVMGFQNLRVVDASLFPEIPNGPTYPATLMMAEMASRFILEGR